MVTMQPYSHVCVHLGALQSWLRQAEVCIERIDVSGTGLVTHSHGWSAEQQASEGFAETYMTMSN